ncbi:MAG: inositol monophosphatase [Proteobacteria bacterium]|nr:inositol monophosphatase [Pseudomonadota bacterium]MDE3208552.1 inositol monophosphatase [Pseudomonadota bacterium]
MHPMLSIAVKAARRASNIINRAASNVDLIHVTSKGPADYVSEVDKASEAAIIETLSSSYPSHAFIGEESGNQGDSEYVWIIDPLDGTTNFLHGLPHYAISIALKHRGILTQAVIYDPNRNELFTATRGAGAFLNDRRIRVSRCTKISDSLIGTGFPFREFSSVNRYLAIFHETMKKCAGLRRPGAASLDLAYVASGRYDAFFESGLGIWDIAAGALLIQEAGGICTDWDGEDNFLEKGQIICGNPKVFSQMLNIIRNHPE